MDVRMEENIEIVGWVEFDVNGEVLETALAIAGGDYARLEIRSENEVVVHNQPFPTKE